MAKKERLNGLLLAELARAVNREVNLANALITITYVDCSSDLKQAKVGFSVLPDNLAGTALMCLKAASGELIACLRRRTKLRQLPHLLWEFDASEREAEKIEVLLKDIGRAEKKEKGSS